MSKKRLSRTIIEGGRDNYNKWERRNSHNPVRASERDFCKRIITDEERADDDIFILQKYTVIKEFNDKLGPMYRWLHSQIGRSWNDVRSEISKKFDSRTTASRHILNDHLLSSVEEVPDLTYNRFYRNTGEYTTSRYKNDFYVDINGLLQAKTYLPYKNDKIPQFNRKTIVDWLSGRTVGKVGEKLFWFVPTTKNKKRGGANKEWKIEWNSNGYRGYYNHNTLSFLYLYQKPIYSKNKENLTEIIGYDSAWQVASPNLRQDRKLNNKEMIFWQSLPEWYRNKILETSPIYNDKLSHRNY